MPPVTSYLICATPRCGGYLLFEALKNTDLAGNPGEYFWDDKGWAKKWGATDYADFLNKVKEKSTTPNGVLERNLCGVNLKGSLLRCNKSRNSKIGTWHRMMY